MITLSNMRVLSESTEPLYNVFDTFLTESQVMALIELPDDEILSEAASTTLKEIKSSQEMKDAKELISEAKKLRKSNPEESKKKARAALTKLKALRKKAENIEDDDGAKELIKYLCSAVFSLCCLIASSISITLMPQIAFPTLIAAVANLIYTSIENRKIGMARIGQDTTKEAGKILNFKKLSRNQAFAVLDIYIKTASELETNKSFAQKLKSAVA